MADLTFLQKEATCFGGPHHGRTYFFGAGYRFTIGHCTYDLERYTNGSTWYYAWVAEGWWVNGYSAKDYVVAGLEMVRLLSQIGSCEPWKSGVSDRLVCWAENNGIIDKWLMSRGLNPQPTHPPFIKRIVTYEDLNRLYGMRDFTVVLLSGWDSDPVFVDHVMGSMRTVRFVDASLAVRAAPVARVGKG